MNFANFQNQTLHRNDDVSVNKTPRERFSGEWETRQLAELGRFSKGRGIKREDVSYEGLPCVRYGELYTQYHNYIEEVVSRVPPSVAATALPISTGDLLFAGSGETAEEIGRCAAYLGKEKAYAGGDIIVLTPANQNSTYLGHLMNHSIVAAQKARMAQGDAVVHISTNSLAQVQVELPPIAEQNAIAEVLSNVDGLIGALDALIAKKRAIKKATMQQLLTGKTRLPGFGGEWETKRLENVVICLDNVRIPLNEIERANMPGPYPYCGANGVLDYVNDFVLDDDVILIAEDGGYFDEYAHRPIAYRMSGKIWVNNHAHILKANPKYSQGFLFFSLVHKNILPYLTSGTRAKLNKSEMNKIEVTFPINKAEQEAIASVLTDIDLEIAALEKRRNKTHAIKHGMMQQLLTGRVRLVKTDTVPEAAGKPTTE